MYKIFTLDRNIQFALWIYMYIKGKRELYVHVKAQIINDNDFSKHKKTQFFLLK